MKKLKTMKNNYLTVLKLCLFIFGTFIIPAKSIAQYTVTSIPYQVYSGNLPVQATTDDSYSNVISLPFAFDFYGISYNQVLISTNGYIDFRTNLANGNSPFYFNETIPNVAFSVKNSILGNFQDLYNNNGLGSITYGVSGTAPYRKFVVLYNNNALFACSASNSSFQIVLNETSNIIDVQLIDKQVCTSWNSGKSVSGLINLAGDLGISPPNRNTGIWTAFHEAWRYKPENSTYHYTNCDIDVDGFEIFNLQVVQNDLSLGNPAALTFYVTLADAQTSSNPITTTTYTNTSNPQTIYASGNGQIKEIILNTIDCSIDYDLDTVATSSEDINTDGNLANDDTDGDGVPNFQDNDDDGDLILTSEEYVFTNNRNTNSVIDTDNDNIPNYLDNDDDGDGILTYNEDYNGNGSAADDDTNNDSVPDYLQFSVALGISSVVQDNAIELYPNPVNDILNINNTTNETISSITIYAINGSKVKQSNAKNSLTTIQVNDLLSGIYFVKIEMNNKVLNYKFIKK